MATTAPCPVDAAEVDGNSTELAGVKSSLNLSVKNEKAGDEVLRAVYVTQTIRNDSGHELLLARSPTFEANCVRLVIPAGEEAELSSAGRLSAARSARRGHSSSRIFAGATFERGFNLSHYFDLSVPGQYVVHLSTKYKAPNEETAYWTQPDPLHFEVTADGEVKRIEAAKE